MSSDAAASALPRVITLTERAFSTTVGDSERLDALSAWSARQLVFSEDIYHGAGLSAVDDGSGGVHLVYKDSAEELRYRHYDGASWGSPQLVESAAD